MTKVTIKSLTQLASQVRLSANAEIKALREEIKAKQAWRDERIAQIKSEIEQVRFERDAKAVTTKQDKAERSAAWQAKQALAEKVRVAKAIETIQRYKAKLEARRPMLSIAAE
jgi:ferric-dicitrate binding protein FerR (iron transport regulator)